MKKFILGIIAIPLLIGVLYAVPYIFQFIVWLIEIDNTDFGFPLWLDIAVSSASGIIAYIAVGCLFEFLGFYDKESMSKINTVLSIIIGFVISVVVHIILKYWYIALSIVGLLLVGVIIYQILKNHKEA